MSIPRKRFGQNFLTDESIIQQIIQRLKISPDDHVVEIGPGRGALTDHLIKTGCNLTVIEIDRDLAENLQTRYPALELITQDVLKVDFNQLNPRPYRVVGNLPYNISTPLLFKLFADLDHIIDMHFMLQREVVDRITATASTRQYGRLSVMAQLYCEGKKVLDVPPGAFYPPPKVHSAIIQLTPHDAAGSEHHELLQELLATAFSARRKTLRNALKPYLSKEEFDELGIDARLRPENLEVDTYLAIARFVAAR